MRVAAPSENIGTRFALQLDPVRLDLVAGFDADAPVQHAEPLGDVGGSRHQTAVSLVSLQRLESGPGHRELVEELAFDRLDQRVEVGCQLTDDDAGNRRLSRPPASVAPTEASAEHLGRHVLPPTGFSETSRSLTDRRVGELAASRPRPSEHVFEPADLDAHGDNLRGAVGWECREDGIPFGSKPSSAQSVAHPMSQVGPAPTSS